MTYTSKLKNKKPVKKVRLNGISFYRHGNFLSSVSFSKLLVKNVVRHLPSCWNTDPFSVRIVHLILV